MAEKEEGAIYRYKYREMTEGNLKIITEGTLRYSNPTEFNDPFDCFPAYDMKSITNLHKLQPALIKKVADAQGVSPAKRIELRGKYIAIVRRGVESGAWGKELVENVGVLCLSRNPCNPLMWAHYAKNHTGFLVELRIGPDAPAAALDQIVPMEVDYVERRPLLAWGDPKIDVKEYLLKKSRDWAYEEEERAINITGGAKLQPYPREHLLSSVTAGARMSDAKFAELKAAVEQAEQDIGKSIPLYRAQLSLISYKVFIPGHPDPEHSAPE